MQIVIEDRTRARRNSAQSSGWPILRLGFRPFFWLAAAFAAAAVPLWVLRYVAPGVIPEAPVPAYLWHAHEMVFGFVQAVVVGFLFTAARNWTGVDTPSGRWLAALALLWLTARVAVLMGPVRVAAVLDLAFTLAAAASLAGVLYRADNRRNYFLVALLGGLAVVDLLFFASLTGRIVLAPLAPIRLALLLMVFLVTVIGGRIIPMFTRNATGATVVRRPVLDLVAQGSLFAAILTQLVDWPAAITAPLWFLCCLLQAARLAGWSSMSTTRQPILWILHLSYAWIPVGLLMFGFSQLGRVSPILALHALSIGAISGMIIGMMTRVARGHTGRPLRAGRIEVAAFVLVQLAAAVRVGMPLVLPGLYRESVVLSGALFGLGFLCFLVVFTPILWKPRADGAPG